MKPTPGGPDPAQTQPDVLTAVARTWADAVAGTSYVPLPRAEVEALLRALLGRLQATLVADRFRPEEGCAVGAALVDAHFTDARTLSHSLTVLWEAAARLDAPRSQVGARWHVLVGALAEGYARASQERALREQDEIVTAALTARYQAEQALQMSEARLRAVFAGARVGIGIGDLDGRIIDLNPALAAIFGYPTEELRRRRVQDFMHPTDSEPVWRLYDDLIRGDRDHFRVEKQFFRANGDSVWTHLSVSLLRDEAGRPQYQLAVVHDVTELQQLQTQLRYEAHHDPLTGLPNRTLFLAQLDSIFASAEAGTRVGLCFLDLDGFKAVNDTLGHEVGDQLLVKVARRIDDVVTAAGHLVGRLGGDEFVVLVPGSTGRGQLVELADRMLAVLAAPVHLAGREIAVSASIGIVERPVEGIDPAELLRAADMTLYWAKADGKNRWAVFEPDRDARDINRYALSSALPAALDQEQFVLHYQPLMKIADRSLHGVEALVRWRHPTLGLIGPDEFVGLAEESGLIVPLGRWVLQAACRQAYEWFGTCPGSPFISVNLAAQQLREPGLVEDIRNALVSSGLHPQQLQLEITESAIVGTDHSTRSTLRRLSDMDLRIAIDDFGTGYSNLAYLRHLPIDEIKLDGFFLRGVRATEDIDPVDEQIVASLVSLAHVLGLTVTAEGVETAAQVSLLAAMGCDAGQGTHLGPPADAVEMAFRPPARPVGVLPIGELPVQFGQVRPG
ncbi:MAG: GGDEF domain-containing protein [Pseudonocardiales bacterium]|nr:MAG: GGDEF domain-containing protein [Pseudonocardiales bacterium]